MEHYFFLRNSANDLLISLNTFHLFVLEYCTNGITIGICLQDVRGFVVSFCFSTEELVNNNLHVLKAGFSSFSLFQESFFLVRLLKCLWGIGNVRPYKEQDCNNDWICLSVRGAGIFRITAVLSGSTSIPDL